MTYLGKFKQKNPWMFEFSGLIFTRCPGHYFEGAPKGSNEAFLTTGMPDCLNPENPNSIGCIACWNQECSGRYIKHTREFPYDSEEVYGNGT